MKLLAWSGISLTSALLYGEKPKEYKPCDFMQPMVNTVFQTTLYCDSIYKELNNYILPGWYKINQTDIIYPKQTWRRPYMVYEEFQVYCFPSDQGASTLFSTKNFYKFVNPDIEYQTSTSKSTEWTRSVDETKERGVMFCGDGTFNLGNQVFQKFAQRIEYCFSKSEYGTSFQVCETQWAEKSEAEISEESSLIIADTFSKELYQFNQPIQNFRRRKFLRAIQHENFLPLAQSRPAFAIFNNELWMCGGKLTNEIADPYKDCWSFYPTTGWRNRPSIIFKRSESKMVASNHKLYITGGKEAWIKDMRSTEVFDPQDGSWSRGPLLNYARNSHCAVDFNNTVLIIGGRQSSLNIPYTERLNRKTNQYDVIGQFPKNGLSNHACVVFKNKIYVMGGNVEMVADDSRSFSRGYYRRDTSRFYKIKNKMSLEDFGLQLEQVKKRDLKRKPRLRKAKRSLKFEMSVVEVSLKFAQFFDEKS